MKVTNLNAFNVSKLSINEVLRISNTKLSVDKTINARTIESKKLSKFNDFNFWSYQ